MAKRIILFLILFFIGFLSQICLVYPQAVELPSHWKKHPIVIDGKDDDWQDSKISVGPQKLVLSLANDESYLYLYVYCWDKDLCLRILLSGFTVWFNEDDPDNKIGIRYPVGMRNNTIEDAEKNIPAPGNITSGSFTADKYFVRMQGRDGQSLESNAAAQEQFLKDLNAMLGKMELITAGQSRPLKHYLSFFKEYGIECMVGDSSGGLIYELKLPLIKSKSRIYGLGKSRLKNINMRLDFPSLSNNRPLGNKDMNTQSNDANRQERPHRGGFGGGRGHYGDMGHSNDNNDISPYRGQTACDGFPETMNITLSSD